MTYEQTLHYLYTKLPLYSSLGIKAYKADLNNTIALCNHLGNPQHKIKTIHIAGTNGKGSTSSMLASVFHQNGYKTGLYTSPHLKDFRERIRVNGEMILQDFVIDFVEKIQSFSEEINPSFFELTFVMALEYFVQQNVEIAIIETGLGGRLDSTNVIMPELSVITNIGYDHMDILGDTIEKIATEKAGIIKQNIQVIIGETTNKTKEIFNNVATEKNAPIVFAEERFQIISTTAVNETLQVEMLHNGDTQTKKYVLDLTGFYQAKNLRTVLAAIEVLKNKYSFQEINTENALSHVKELSGLHGRWEIVARNPLIVLDVAHNVDGIQQLIHQINKSSFKKLHLVFGMVKDKEIDKVLELLPAQATYYFTKAQIARALPENELLQKAQAFKLNGLAYSEVNEALKSAIDAASEEDMIIVCGSVFIVGEVDNLKLKNNLLLNDH